MGRILLTRVVDEVAGHGVTADVAGARAEDSRNFLPRISAEELWLSVGAESVGDVVCANCGVMPVVSRLGTHGMAALEWVRYRKLCEVAGGTGVQQMAEVAGATEKEVGR